MSMSVRNVDSVRIVLNFGLELGMTRSEILEGSEISCEQLFSAEQSVESWQELRVIANIVEHCQRPRLVGIELGKRYPFTSYGIFGYAILSSTTLRNAFGFGTRFLDLTYVFSRLALSVKGKKFSVSFNTDVSGQSGEAVMYRDLFATLNIFSDLYAGRLLPIDIHLKAHALSAEEQQAISHYEHLIEGSVFYSSRENCFSGKIELLDAPLPKGDEHNARTSERLCLALLEKKRSMLTLSSKVRDYLKNEGASSSMEQFAQEVGMTTRTLHRKLGCEGVSWRTLRNLVLTDMAEDLLAQDLSVKEVAIRLGYEDPANFSHFFKRIKGYAPSVSIERCGRE